MIRLKRLTWDDLDNLTRDELLPRLEAEQAYWARKGERGLSDADQQARRQFSDILYAAINPSDLADSMAETTAWLKGERSTDSSYWHERPGVMSTDQVRSSRLHLVTRLPENHVSTMEGGSATSAEA